MAIIGEEKPVASTIVTADRIWAADGEGIRHRAFVQYEGDTITSDRQPGGPAAGDRAKRPPSAM